ncbi:MAG: electron transport complex subunit RsxC [Oscillospiraceae bacterium]
MFKYLKRSALGANVPHEKGTAAKATVQLVCPSEVLIAMQQHIGAPAIPCVKKGDTVYVGTLIGKANGFVSANIHSSVSGTVSEITELLFSNGANVQAVRICADGEQQPDPAIHAPEVIDHASFVSAVCESGLVGLGGAGFPTHVKLSPKNLDDVNTLVINGAECEPFITADSREFLENSSTIMSGILAVKQYLDIKKVIIAIERNKPEAIDLMCSLAKGDTNISVKPLATKYPQGAEKILIEKTTGREVPRGKLPSDVGVLVLNVTTVSAIGKYLNTGMPIVQKRITVDGDAVKTPKNVMVPIGTSLESVIKFCGGYTKEPAKIITGGPMMGVSVVDTSFPILKQNNAILVFGEKSAKLPEPGPCIRCGRCINACPLGLSPVELATAFSHKDAASLKKLQIDLCMGCGTCSYVCPAKRPVTQNMNLAKAFEKNGGR